MDASVRTTPRRCAPHPLLSRGGELFVPFHDRCHKRRQSIMRHVVRILCAMALLPALFAQTPTEMYRLQTPTSIELSSDGSRLFYRLGKEWWEVETGFSPRPKRSDKHKTATLEKSPQVQETARLSSPRRSPDGKRLAYLDAEKPYGPLLLFCQCGGQQTNSKVFPLSRMPVMAFQWAQDSNSLWVIGVNGADEPIGRLDLNGHFEQITQGAAMRRTGGLATAGDVVAWVQSDGSHHGTIWVHDRLEGLA